MTSQNHTTKIIPYSQIKLIHKDNKQKYCQQWKTETQTINTLECYNLLDREFQLAQYLTQIKKKKDKPLQNIDSAKINLPLKLVAIKENG